MDWRKCYLWTRARDLTQAFQHNTTVHASYRTPPDLQVLSADVNHGFQELQNYQVYKVNGVKVHNLQHLAQLVERCESEYIRFDMDWKRVRDTA
jgi:hypothetical protein